ncbi:glycogen debranching N-terminal domain-containing protein [Cryobacterium sp. PH31-L1]|uniref:glycogen debranching N-terminal domain-containing protein n=1 Tax=Cryobacterium sp. PH31-L1 TaxID=3046199 RepID=UPI0024BBD621|nr:glycogen debranching N-terminal domain-containing protein [Cryobacterium sp. PH31-L1]MDJ0377469.1 glycogen debranching N-terminal domain-containing protein [Cryobacterium sp. PH31-L1]
MSANLQPLIHDEIIVLRAPTQAWSAADGSIGSSAIHGFFFSDVRLVSSLGVTVGNSAGELIATVPRGADSITFIALQRHLDDRMPDPRVRTLHTRTTTVTGIFEEFVVASDLQHTIETTIEVLLQPDLSTMDHIKSGLPVQPAPPTARSGSTATWLNASVSAALTATGASITELANGTLRLLWPVTVPARGETRVDWSITAADSQAVVRGVDGPASWSVPTLVSADDRLGRWVEQALVDLDSLRLRTVAAPDEVFLAAGAPWFFTLFGRDSIWAARMMLPLGTTLAGGTLRVLAGLQGVTSVDDTAEQPGKIMHELRRDTLVIHGEGVYLPPLYYGTVDATPLWVCLLHDAWKWGLPDAEVHALLPNLVSALEWMRDFGDADGDGLLEYTDTTGHGLSNQGWKDSGDSVQWRDGSLAEGPIALCEVQAYAYEAAMHGADLLDHFGEPGGAGWRLWASALQKRFNEEFWVDSPDGAYPAIALDAAKRPVDTVTSNLGHLLGTGLLSAEQSALVAARLVSPEMNSGYGLRTLSTDSAGFWPLSYHGGSVWAHDTAIAIAGLARDGFRTEANVLTNGLLAAAASFDYRMPELHSGDSAAALARPIPYPAACRPQAWSAASAISVLASALGLNADAPGGVLGVTPMRSGLTPMTVSGLSFAGAGFSLTVNDEGEIAAASGAAIEVR